MTLQKVKCANFELWRCFSAGYANIGQIDFRPFLAYIINEKGHFRNEVRMPNFEYRVETVYLDRPAGSNVILRYKKQDSHPSVDELGKDGWRLIYLQPVQNDFIAIFEKETS